MNTNELADKIVEKVAAAMRDDRRPEGSDWDTLPNGLKDEYRIIAKAAITAHTAALVDAGYKILRREHTRAMEDAVREHTPYALENAYAEDIWAAMFDAAPLTPEPTP